MVHHAGFFICHLKTVSQGDDFHNKVCFKELYIQFVTKGYKLYPIDARIFSGLNLYIFLLLKNPFDIEHLLGLNLQFIKY